MLQRSTQGNGDLSRARASSCAGRTWRRQRRLLTCVSIRLCRAR